MFENLPSVSGSVTPEPNPPRYSGRVSIGKRSEQGLTAYINQQKKRVRKLVEINYMPIWDAGHDVLSTYAVDCCLKESNEVGGYVNIIGRLKRRDKVVLDHILAEECVEMLKEFKANNFRAVFSLPVSFETVFNPALRSSFIRILEQIPEDMLRYTSLTLMEFPAGIPETKFRSIISVLGRFSRLIILYCSNFIPQDFSFYASCGIKGISLSLSQTRRSDGHYWNKLVLMAIKCQEKSLKTTVINIDTQDELFLARQADFDFIAGEAISRNTEAPGHMVRIGWKELLGGMRPTF